MNPHVKKRTVITANGPRYVRPVDTTAEAGGVAIEVTVAIYFEGQRV